MSILSDITITELCVCPEIKTDFESRLKALCEDFGKTRNHPEQLKDLLPPPGVFLDQRIDELIANYVRPTTDVERAAFVPMITPFHPESVKLVDGRKIISKGLTSFGYDVTLTGPVKIFSNIHSVEIDPKRFDENRCLVDPIIRTDVDGGQYVTLPANSYLLGPTEEYFRIPRNILIACLGKSTYARSGVMINATPIEPEFEGQVVIEVFNGTTSPVRIYLNEGIAQFLFFRGDRACGVSYKDRAGKYQGQTGLTLSKV